MKKVRFLVFILSSCIFSLSCSEDSSCDDGILNGIELSIDCGGDCPPCSSCTDGITNGSEISIDCGGSCPPCPDCMDGILNGDETDIDCGGSCIPCPTCTDGVLNGTEEAIDCGGADCPICPTCNDGIQNGNETDIDCGGSCCDCPTCYDMMFNGDETGVDCGGICNPCDQNQETFVVRIKEFTNRCRIGNTEDGGVIISNSKSVSSFENDLYFAKISDIGRTEWAVTYDRGKIDDIYDIITEPQRIIAATHTNGPTIILLDYDGEIMEEISLPSALGDNPRQIIAAVDGGYIILMDDGLLHCDSNFAVVNSKNFKMQQIYVKTISITVDDKYMILHGGEEVISKLDLDLNIMWTATISDRYDTSNFVSSPDGSLFIATQSEAVSSSGQTSTQLTRVDSQGDLLWTQKITPAGFLTLSIEGMLSDTDGCTLLVSERPFTNITNGKLLRYSNDGDLLWAQTYFAASSSFVRTQEGGYACIGTSPFNYYLTIAKLDNEGKS